MIYEAPPPISHQNAGSHGYVANRFQITVFFQFLETQYEADDSRQPDKRENAPAPTSGMPHDKQCERRIRSRNVQVDRPVIEFAKQLFQSARVIAVIPCGTDIRRKHAKQINGYTSHRPVRFGAGRRFREQEIPGYDSKQNTCPVTERVCPFFDVIISFIFQCLLSTFVMLEPQRYTFIFS